MARRGAGLGTGLLVGLLWALPLLAICGLAHQLLHLPFPPFDAFEWTTRHLPGPWVTRSIELLVRVLGLLGLSLRGTAKMAEQLLALLLYGVIAGVVAATTLFLILKWHHQRRSDARRQRIVGGALVGAGLGLAAVALSFASPERCAGLGAVRIAWLLVVLTSWGLGVAWTEERLLRLALRDGDRASVERAGRRRFLVQLGGASASVTVVGAVLAAVVRRTSRPDVATGPGVVLPARPGALPPAPGTRPEYTPLAQHYRIDIDLAPPRLDGQSWSLPIAGLVEHPVTLRLEDFHEHLGAPMHQFITLSCVSNPIAGDLIGTTQWSGVSLQRVLELVRPQPRAKFLFVVARDGFYETVPLELIRADPRIMLAHSWDNRPLTAEHGYPLRLYIPDRYGMKQPKWITELRVVEQAREGYWVERGWDREARIQTTSVIDTVAVDEAREEGGRRLIPVGGIAHAGARGISRVEVSVDGGPWLQAGLRTPLSGLTWVVWRYDWPFEAGRHTFAVRCTDGNGMPQSDEPHPPHPSGATGIHRVSKTI